MKKKFKLQDLDCANCAAKMEEAIKRIEGVADANVSFMTQKMTIEAEESRFDEIMKEVVAVCRKVEPDVRSVRRRLRLIKGSRPCLFRKGNHYDKETEGNAFPYHSYIHCIYPSGCGGPYGYAARRTRYLGQAGSISGSLCADWLGYCIQSIPKH